MKKDSNTTSKTILLSAGGTGGHLFPAQALATELLQDGHDVIFATDERGMVFYEKSAWPQKDQVSLNPLQSATWRPGIFGKISALFTMGLGVLQALKLIKTKKPDCIVGFGGYPSFPAMFAGQLLGVPTVLHEQNAVVGKANAKLAQKAQHIALSLPGTKGIDSIREKTSVTGNPVRAEILAHQNTTLPHFDDNSTLNIFVMGGSQGARIFGEVIPEAIKKLPEHLQKRISIQQQCRPEEINDVTGRFSVLEATSNIQTFFTDVETQLSNCHVFIGRSGASTVAEVAAVGRPAIFVPMQHADQQQKHNANVIADTGGGWVMTEDGFTDEALATRLESFFNLPEILTKAAVSASGCGRPYATRDLAAVIYKTIGLGTTSATTTKTEKEKKDIAA